jgi:hypothetical protein
MIARILVTLFVFDKVDSFCFLTSQRLSKHAVCVERRRSHIFWSLLPDNQQKIDDHIFRTKGFRQSIRSIFIRRERIYPCPKVKHICVPCQLCSKTSSRSDRDFLDSAKLTAFQDQHQTEKQWSVNMSQESEPSRFQDEDSEATLRRKSYIELLHRIRSGMLTEKEKESFFMSALKSGSTVHTRQPAIISDPGHPTDSSKQTRQRCEVTVDSVDRAKTASLLKFTNNISVKSEISFPKTVPQNRVYQTAGKNLGQRLAVAAFSKELEKRARGNKLDQAEDLGELTNWEKSEFIKKENDIARIIEEKLFKVDALYKKLDDGMSDQQNVFPKPSVLPIHHEQKLAFVAFSAIDQEREKRESKSGSAQKLRPVVALSGKLSYVNDGEQVGYRKSRTRSSTNTTGSQASCISIGNDAMSAMRNDISTSIQRIPSNSKQSTQSNDMDSKHGLPSTNKTNAKVYCHESLQVGKDSTERAKQWGIDVSKYINS